MNEVKLKIGTALVPALELAAPKIEWLAEKITNFAGEIPWGTEVLVGITGAVGVLALAVAPVITAIVNLGLAISWLGRRSERAAAATLADAIGGPAGGKLGRGGFRGLGGKIRGLRSGGFRGLAGRAGEFGRTLGPKAIGALKGRLGWVSAIIGPGVIGKTLLDKQLSAGEKAAEVTKEAGGIGGALAGMALGAGIGDSTGGRSYGLGRRAPRAAAAALAAPLAAAGLALPDATPDRAALLALEEHAETPEPRPAGPALPPSVTWNVRISIQQLPGESADELADRVLERLEDAQRQGRLEGLYDAD